MEDMPLTNATGSKLHYYSANKKAEIIRYTPRYAYMEAIAQESKFILK